jgi:hypothetical protein
MENVEAKILALLQPYQERIDQLEASLKQKDNEVLIYKLALERLEEIAKLQGGSKQAGAVKPSMNLRASTSTLKK